MDGDTSPIIIQKLESINPFESDEDQFKYRSQSALQKKGKSSAINIRKIKTNTSSNFRVRTDAFGKTITKELKEHKVTFLDDLGKPEFIETHEVKKYKHATIVPEVVLKPKIATVRPELPDDSCICCQVF